MALSTVYRVVTKYESDTSRAQSGMMRLHDRADRLSNKLEGVQRRLGGIARFVGRAAMGALTVGFGMAARQAVKLNQQLEDAKTGMAAVMESGGMGAFTDNLERAERLMDKLGKAAIKSPGTKMDMVSMVRANMPVLSKLNLTDEQFTKFARRGGGAAFSLMGNDTKTTEQQLLAMMQGRGGADQALFNALANPVAEQLGLSDGAGDLTQQLNKIAKTEPKKFFGALMKSLIPYEKAALEAANSFTGLWSSAVEILNSTLLSGSAPVFKWMKGQLMDLIDWVEKNHDMIQRTAVEWGEKLVVGLTKAGKAIRMVAGNIELVITALGTLKAMQLAGGFGALSSIVSGGISKTAGAGRGALRFPLDFAGQLMFGGRNAMTAGGKAANALSFRNLRATDKFKMGTRLQQGAMMAGTAGKGALSKAAAGLSKLGPVLMKLLRVAGPIALIFGAVSAAAKVLRDESSMVGKFFWHTVEQLQVALDHLFIAFGLSGGAGGLMGLLRKFGTFVGEVLVLALSTVVRAVTGVINIWNKLVMVIQGAAGTWAEVFSQWERGGGGLRGFGNIDFDLAAQKGFKFAEEQYLKNRMAADDLAEKRKKKQEDLKKRAEKPPKRPPVNITLNQEFKTNANPDQIAFRTRDLIEKSLFKNKRAIQLLTDG